MEEKDLDLTCGLTDDELTERFKESIRVDNELRTILGLPIAKFDIETNKAYLEYPNGKKEYVDDPHRAFKTDDYSLTVDKSGNKDSLKHILMNELLRCFLESRRGYAFVADNSRVNLDSKLFYISLVLYNIQLRCFVLISIRTTRCSEQDYSLMNSCVRYFDERRKRDCENPTMGITICCYGGKTTVRYVISDSEKPFASSDQGSVLFSVEELKALVDVIRLHNRK